MVNVFLALIQCMKLLFLIQKIGAKLDSTKAERRKAARVLIQHEKRDHEQCANLPIFFSGALMAGIAVKIPYAKMLCSMTDGRNASFIWDRLETILQCSNDTCQLTRGVYKI